MMPPSAPSHSGTPPSQGQGIFPPTRWSLIHRMQDGNESTRRESLAAVCSTYWKPVYAWLRAKGAPPADAEDTTQEFFARLISGHWLAEVHEQKGRLRSFLLVLLKRHAAAERDYREAKKRGGDRTFVPFNAEAAEAAWSGQTMDGASPDVVFDRQWALQLLDRVMLNLRQTYQNSGKGDLFEELRDYLTGGSVTDGYSATASRLGMSESAVKAAAFRLRERYRERLRAEVLDTLDSPDGVDEEIRWLFSVFQ